MRELETDDLTYTIDGHIAYLTFDRPDKKNAYTPTMRDEAVKALRDANEDEDVRAIIVTGAGDEAFCAGADLGDTISEVSGGEREVGDAEYDIAFREEMLTTPIIAAVNGYCIAGGMEFLQVTDIRIAEPNAKFGLPEPKWGLSPVGGSHVRLPRQIPYCRAMEIILTGDFLSAEEAHKAGLVNQVVDEGDALSHAEEIAKSIAENSPNAVQKSKEIVLRGLRTSMDDAFDLERKIGTEIFTHPDATEGPKAFSENREPSWQQE